MFLGFRVLFSDLGFLILSYEQETQRLLSEPGLFRLVCSDLMLDFSDDELGVVDCHRGNAWRVMVLVDAFYCLLQLRE